MFEEADVIFSYSRTDAIRDGVLVDVSSHAKSLGFRIPVALTAGLHEALTAGASDEAEIAARLDLLLTTLRDNIARNPGRGDRLDFTVKGPSFRPLNAWALCGPGDTPDPVLTVMLPHED
jgi:hypothetical protein